MELKERDMPSIFSIGERAYERLNVILNVQGMPRDEVKSIAKWLHNYWNAEEVNRTWLGQEATKSQMVEFITTGYIKRSVDQAIIEKVDVDEEARTNGTEPDLAQVIAEAIQGRIKTASVSPAQLNAAVDAKIDELKGELEELIGKQSQRIIVENRLTGQTIDVGVQHERFAPLLKRIECALAGAKRGKFLNIWLVGPAGSGKTTACENAAKALGMNFEFNGALDSEHKLLGFVDAQGRIVSRPFRKAWENGGIYLFDEVDASMPGACLALNAALANGYCDFPDCKVDRNLGCVCIASGNVWQGATEEYVGRFKPDAAFSDRFIKFAWNYDEKLERSLAGNDTWVDYVQGVRRNVKAKGVKIVVSPRASIFGALMLECGIPWPEVVEETIRKGLAEATWNSISNVEKEGY